MKAFSFNPARPVDMRSHSAFTMVELLVVISIIAILASALMTGIGAARLSAKKVICQSNLRQMGMAFLVFPDLNDGYWPTGVWNQSISDTLDDSASAFKLSMCPARATSTYAYTGVYYDSIAFDGNPKEPQYPFGWASWLPQVRISEALIVRRAEKAALSEYTGIWGGESAQ